MPVDLTSPKIVVGYDGSPTSRDAVAAAGLLARTVGATVILGFVDARGGRSQAAADENPDAILAGALVGRDDLADREGRLERGHPAAGDEHTGRAGEGRMLSSRHRTSRADLRLGPREHAGDVQRRDDPHRAPPLDDDQVRDVVLDHQARRLGQRERRLDGEGLGGGEIAGGQTRDVARTTSMSDTTPDTTRSGSGESSPAPSTTTAWTW
jgi:hypothetical protein